MFLLCLVISGGVVIGITVFLLVVGGIEAFKALRRRND